MRRARHGIHTGKMRNAYKIVICELQRKNKEDKKTLSVVIWFQNGKLQETSAFCHCGYLCFFFPAAFWLNQPIFCKATYSRRLKSAGILLHIKWHMATGVSRIAVSLSNRVKQSVPGLLDPADKDIGNVGMYVPLKTM
jgi:hypothetical protein